MPNNNCYDAAQSNSPTMLQLRQRHSSHSLATPSREVCTWLHGTKDSLPDAPPNGILSEREQFHPANMQPGDDYYEFPDPPPRFDMQNFLHLHQYGYSSAIEQFLVSLLGDSVTVTVISEAYLAWASYQRGGWFVPDLLVSFNAKMPDAIVRNGYAIDEQGKPPEFVLEIASQSTGRIDDTVKRVGYANFGVQEYWRFDPSGGGRHRTHLAGDRLVNGEYQPIEIIKVDEDNYRGYSEVLRLELRWEHERLRWYDPVGGEYLKSYDEEVEAREAAEAQAQEADAERRQEREARLAAEAQQRQQRQARQAAEARNRELQAELDRLRRQSQ